MMKLNTEDAKEILDFEISVCEKAGVSGDILKGMKHACSVLYTINAFGILYYMRKTLKEVEERIENDSKKEI